MATLKDIAERVGVSISTVSRIINNDTSRSVNEETRTKVLNTAREIGYFPNQNARNLVNGKGDIEKSTKKVGCIVSVPQNKYNHPYFSHIFEGIEKGLEENDFSLAYIYTLEQIRNSKTLYSAVDQNEIDGLIIVEGLDEETYSFIKKHVKHIVGIDVSDKSIPRVTYDRIEAAKAAINHLISQGIKDIGFIGGIGLSGDMEKEKRFKGYKTALKEAGIPINMDWVLNANWDVETSYRLVGSLLDSGKKIPSAIFAASDMLAISGMRAVNERGLSIPNDIAFIGLDNIEISQYTTPPLSTISVPKFDIGKIAANILMNYISGNFSLPVKVDAPFELLVRQSSTLGLGH